MSYKNINFFLILSLFIIFFAKIDFAKKTFFLISKTYNERFTEAYNKNLFSGFCSKESHGYINFIKNKFELKKTPKILNFTEKRNKIPNWIFYNNQNKYTNDQIILINYTANKEFNFDNYKIKNNFLNSCFFLIVK